MPEKILVGVDGGATKCTLRMEDSRGRLLGEARGGPANIRLSVENTWHSISEAFSDALHQANIDPASGHYEFYAGMALAGCEVKSACENFLKQANPFKKIILESDAYAACLGANAGQDCAIIIIGTGVVGMQIESGKTLRVAGWGFPHGDEGGGAWLGLEAIRLTLQWRDGRISASPLLKALSENFDNDESALVTWASNANSTTFATLAPLIVEFADRKDPHALHLMQQAGEHIDRVGFALASRAARPDLPCSLFGGLAPFIEPWTGPELRARLQPSRLDATVGAIIMIREHLQCETEHDDTYGNRSAASA